MSCCKAVMTLQVITADISNDNTIVTAREHGIAFHGHYTHNDASWTLHPQRCQPNSTGPSNAATNPDCYYFCRTWVHQTE
uniref:Uncharacterized protein n=1 Tax=Romanomermis culicivorax TaxID=13658 RepID=A0A915IAM4_ROMCU